MRASDIYIITVVCIALMATFCIIAIHFYRQALSLKPLLDDRRKILKDIEIAQETLFQKKQEISNLDAEKVEAETKIKEYHELKAWVDENGGSIDELKKQIGINKDAFENLNEQIKEKEGERDTLIEEIKGLKEEKDQSNIEIENNQKLKIELELKQKELETSIKSSEEKLASIKEEIKKHQDILDKINKEIENKKSLMEELNQLKASRNNMEKIVSELETTAAGLQGQVEAKKVALNDIWKDLDRPMFNYNPSRNRAKANEKSMLNKFESNLEKYDIKFPERTINAFHTGLKAADSSPIVVLSGISGTGKSLLPKLYSDFMGMNFTAMAVQPRWDSPQDMLGFYNYMQQRYKATELSRILWQFDYYNNENCQNHYDSADDLPMNIVLLDEMNIARVEYYFSDMLSKLELRRTINSKKDKQRKDAEIEIECGALDDSKFARKLFINSNTLFVGTMNEDETTQVLSDKVLDRSNVIRFGKPEDLQAKANTQGFTNSCDLESSLSLDQWKNDWCSQSSLNSTEKIKLKDTIEAINIQLEKVNRPFGHRVWNSIENYMNLYPAGHDSYKNALSDQIEMKILTKLNGLEKENQDANEVLSEIGSIVQKVGDDKLSSAYDIAKNDPSNAFFQWHGVIR
jgi:uncharacterized coiled-coil DUF342 family protein